jgi:tricorn protease-like protein
MYQENIPTQSLSIYEYDLNSYKTQVININYADYGLKNTNTDDGAIVFAAEGYIYLMNQSIGYNGELSAINMLRINMTSKTISKLKSLNTSAFRSMYSRQLYAFTNGNKIYFEDLSRIYNAPFFVSTGYTMTINKEDFQLVQSELLPIKPNLSKYQNLTDSPSNLLNLRAFSVSSAGKMYRLLSTDFRVEPSIAALLKILLCRAHLMLVKL